MEHLEARKKQDIKRHLQRFWISIYRVLDQNFETSDFSLLVLDTRDRHTQVGFGIFEKAVERRGHRRHL
jgi:hypothetical protein